MDPTNKEHEVIISDKAAEMLVSHVHFLAGVNPQASDVLREKVTQAAMSLTYFPERNPFISNPLFIANKYRKMIIDKRYILVYQIVSQTVYVEYVLDCR